MSNRVNRKRQAPSDIEVPPFKNLRSLPTTLQACNEYDVAMCSLLKEPLYEIPKSVIGDEEPDLSGFKWKSDDMFCYTAEKEGNLTLLEKAWAFVQEVQELHDGLNGSFRHLWGSDASFNQLHGLVESLLSAQAQFRSLGGNASIDIGYHYTKECSLGIIRDTGLLTRTDRHLLGITPSRQNGAVYGDGIYTASNPFSHSSYGNICLFVARLRGNETSLPGKDHQQWGPCQDTKVIFKHHCREIVLLRTAMQCIPLMGFHASVLSSRDGAVLDICSRLQGIIDRHFNHGGDTF